MYLWVLHRDIRDWNRFDAIGADTAHAPANARSLAYFPARDHRSAVCVWRTDDMGALCAWIDGKTVGLSTNEYVEIDDKHAMGLVKVAAHA